MNNNQGNHNVVVYKIISLLFVGLIITITYIDISGKYFQQNIDIFTVNSPLIFPFLVFLTLFIGFIFELRAMIKEVLPILSHNKNDRKIGQNKNLIQSKETFHIFSFIVISLIYVYILPRLHFNLATSIYMFCIMIIINEKDQFISKLIKAFIATGVTIPVIYYIFYEVFEVILP
ncbi:MAG: tripartite tricarboxylate transporter TctB family protein [Candidatus Atribacteria bacterium]|nr:tripartite tricarboxylate transporter TctB family protein [Candidatus Atribacteria bacterium]